MIVYILIDWRCFLFFIWIAIVFSFSCKSLLFPAQRCDISGTLMVFLVVLCSAWQSTWGLHSCMLFWQETLAWRNAYAMHNVDLQALFSLAVLLNLVFSLIPQDVFVLPPDESLEQGRNRTRMLTCVIPVMLLSLIYLLIDVVFSF